ncbi:MAG: sigma-54-dependent transcriptional regulator [Bacillota bacterium]|jgi:two-component system NtrC family response regulator
MSVRPKILVVDDEKEVTTFLLHLLRIDYDVTVAYSGIEVDNLLNSRFFDAAIIDLKLTDTDGLSLLSKIKDKLPHCSVIIMTGYSTVSSAVQAIQQGAIDYIEKPFDDLNYLKSLVRDALGGGKNKLSFSENGDEGFVIGTNSVMQNLISIARKIADKDLTILIEGETGTGKEVFALYIHRYSNRAAHPFLAVNCGAFTETLLESELFGHEKGAFTGAFAARRGIFEMANQGTLFLDEISEASIKTQVKLLRLLENKEFFRIGGEHPCQCNARLIAATNVDLAEAVNKGRFREDLYYRLNVINFRLPPLRERKEDIPLLVEYVVKNKFKQFNTNFSSDTLKLLIDYSWPGNVRELINIISRALALCDGREITPAYLSGKILCSSKSKSNQSMWGETLVQNAEYYLQNIDFDSDINLPHIIDEMKTAQTKVAKMIIRKILVHTDGNQSKAAELLRISNRQLQYYLKER